MFNKQLLLTLLVFVASGCSNQANEADSSLSNDQAPESAAALNAEQSCQGYITYVSVNDAKEVDTDGIVKECFQSTDVNGKPYESCPAVRKKGDILTFATPRAVGNKVLVCEHGGGCFNRSDFHFVTCQSEGSAESTNPQISPPAEELFTASKQPERGNTYPEIIVTSKANEVVLSGISINRGNCNLLYISSITGNDLPLSLKFGDQFSFRGLCDPSEITLTTDKGSETIEW